MEETNFFKGEGIKWGMYEVSVEILLATIENVSVCYNIITEKVVRHSGVVPYMVRQVSTCESGIMPRT